jgi:hypothetical protein
MSEFKIVLNTSAPHSENRSGPAEAALRRERDKIPELPQIQFQKSLAKRLGRATALGGSCDSSKTMRTRR